VPRRPLSLALDIYLVVVGALAAIAVSYVTKEAGSLSPALAVIQQFSVPVFAVALTLTVAGAVWRYWMDRPRRPMWTSVRPPYPGLEAFTMDDAAVFFGREPDIQSLLERCNPANPDRAHRFVAVIGPSGVGKSSLVQAGLLPRLGLLRRPWVIVPPLTPEHQPTVSLARSLAQVLKRKDVDAIVQDLVSDSAGLGRLVAAMRDGGSARVLLVIDQAEELLTLTEEAERLLFLESLRLAMRSDPRLWVVAVLRSEFLTPFLQAGWADMFRAPMVVGNLDATALFDVIEKPAARAGIEFSRRVVTKLASDTGGGDALPLLAYTLQELYLQMKAQHKHTITDEDYQALGGVSGMLARRADKVVAELAVNPGAAPALDTLLKFVQLDEGSVTRRRVRRSSLSEAECRVVDAFVSERLLTSAASEGDVVLQVAHEALFRHWAPLAQVIGTREQELRQQAQLERWAHDWANVGRRDSYLLSSDRLVAAQAWAANHSEVGDESQLVQEFLQRSVKSDRAALLRLSESVARRALAGIREDPELSLLLAVAAIEECASTPIAQRALLAALNAYRVRLVLTGHDEVVRGAAWSPDGRRIVTASQDATARVWDASTGSEVLVLRGHADWIRAVAWSPDGALIATAAEDRTARIWDAATGVELGCLRGHLDLLHAVGWSPDSRRLVTGSHDSTARIWDVQARKQLLAFEGHTDWVRGVAWSPDGTQIATASSDRTARIWTAETGSESIALHGHTDWVQSVAWAPDGAHVATASSDRTARIWETSTGLTVITLRGHTDWVHRIEWSPDGERAVTASRDRTARVWAVRAAVELAVLRGHGDWVHDAAWSPDGRHLLTASYDQTARVWDAQAPTEMAVLRGHEGSLQAVAWAPGTDPRIATASHDGTARIWDANTGDELLTLRGHESWVHDVAWSPTSDRLATASRDRTVGIWDSESGEQLAVFRGHDNWVEYIAWSPEGERIATGSNDRTARIWNAETGEQLATLSGHGDWVRDVQWSRDGLLLATVSNDRTVRIWDGRAFSQIMVLQGHGHWVYGVAWSPDGRRIASASSDRTVRIWTVDDGRVLAVLEGHEDAVRAVAWSPDGLRIATASADHTARIWDARSFAPLGVLGVHGDTIAGVAWSPDGRRIATASRDHTGQVWNAATDLASLVALAKQRLLRQLRQDERRTVMLPERLESRDEGPRPAESHPSPPQPPSTARAGRGTT
jgi:WD40 repeat protein